MGEEAKKLFKDAQEMLDDIIANKKLQAKAIVGIFEANEVNGDVYLSKENVTFNFLRQQRKMGSGIPNISLADYVAPQSTGKQDYLGAFAVTSYRGCSASSRLFGIGRGNLSDWSLPPFDFLNVPPGAVLTDNTQKSLEGTLFACS